MAKIGIYLPKYFRLGDQKLLKAVDEATLRRETLKLADKLTDLCGGCTQIEVTGYYKFPDGFFSEAPTIEMYCFCADDSAQSVADELKPILSDLRLRLRQNTIGLYVQDGKFIEC